MNRRSFLSLSLLFWASVVTIPEHMMAAKIKFVPDADTRNFVTSVDQNARTITVITWSSKLETVYTLADPKWYKIEIIIDDQEKSFKDVVVGLQYMTCREVQAGVVDSITFCTTNNPPKDTKK